MSRTISVTISEDDPSIPVEELGPDHQSYHRVQRRHRGAHNEMVAIAWLLRHGFDVFRNVSDHGEMDIVAIRPSNGELFYVDVTVLSATRTTDGGIYYSGSKKGDLAEAHARGVPLRALYVNPVDLNCSWSVPRSEAGPAP